MMDTVRKVLSLFGKKGRWELLQLLGLTLMMALVQTLGVASILPFMSLVSNPDLIETNQWMRWIYDTLGFDNSRSFLIFAALAVLGVTAFSNAFTAFHHWTIVRFVWRKQHQLSVRLLKRYLGESYLFHVDRNSATLGKNLLAEVGEVLNGLVVPGLKLIANCLVVISIFGLLLIVDVTIAVVSVVLLGGIYALIYSAVRRRQARLGRIRRDMNSERYKAVSEALGAIKETLVLGRESEFLRRFSKPAKRFAQAGANNAVISDIPRYAVETVAFGGILLIMVYMMSTREDFGQAVAMMSLYAFAGYRLMPALQNIFFGLAKMRFFGPALDHLHNDLIGSQTDESVPSYSPQDVPAPLPFEREIVVDNVSFKYPGRESWVARHVNLRLEKNSLVGFVGSTGSGKTTIVDIMLGLLDPQEGCVRVDGEPITGQNLPAWRRQLGYVPQHIFLGDDTLTRNIAFGIPDDEIDRAAVERAVRMAQLEEFVAALPNGLDTIVGERGVRLSGGQRQRIGIARAQYHDPAVLIMDEATSALDGITEDSVMDAINGLSRQKTIVLVAHRISTLRDCDRIYLFQEGQIAGSGTYEELAASSEAFRAMAKIDFQAAS